VLVELGLVEQRYKAVLEVLNDGASVTDVARRYGVGRQTVHTWLRRYAAEGLGGLVDHSARPDTCPHQMPPHVEARVLEMRRLHRAGGRGRSSAGSSEKGSNRCRAARRSIGPSCATS
jgi:transposase-like protein